MGIPFNSTESYLSKPKSENGVNNEKSNFEIGHTEGAAPIQPPKDTEPVELDCKALATVEVIALPPEPIKLKYESSFKEFLRQLGGITPGMIILLITGMQLCWAVTEFDMAVYNKMYSDSIYKVGMIIVCGFYFGGIFGQLIGAILVIHLRKKFIYLICSFLLIVSGELLKNCYEVPYHVMGRTMLGFVHSIAHLTVITYASEATTKRIRLKLLTSLAFINMLSICMATGIAIGNIDGNDDPIGNITIAPEKMEYVADDLDIVSISGMVIMMLAVIALVLTPFTTRESVAFSVRKNNNAVAYKEFVTLVGTSKSDSVSLNKFENWKNLILTHPNHTMNIFRKENFKSLMSLAHTRILSLLFNSIFVSVMFTRLLLFDEETNVRLFYNETMSYDLTDLRYSLELLVSLKIIGYICGMVLLIFGLKWKVDRFCYKLAFVWSLSAFIVYVIYSCMDVIKIKLPFLVIAILLYSILVIYMIVPFKFDVLQYEQVAKIYNEENDNYKIWSLVFVGCLENILQLWLLMNIFLFPSLAALLTDFGIFYISLWLLKNMPNDGTVHPLRELFRKAANFQLLRN